MARARHGSIRLPLGGGRGERGAQGASALEVALGRAWRTLEAALLLAGQCAVLLPRVAHAEWTRLSWDECGAGILARQFACDTNVGQARIVVSAFRDSVGFFTPGFACSLDVFIAAEQPSAWWQVAALGCRTGALTASAAWQPADARCLDAWGGQLSSGVLLTTHDNPPRVEIIAAGADQTGTLDMQPLIETFLLAIDLHFNKSTGAGACAGCSAPACIVLRGVEFYDSQPPPYVRVAPLPGQDILAWQSNSANCLLTPVRNKTWGAIKALFR